MAELEGKTLERYELRRIIGRGGMAHVYEAYDLTFQRVVAVKVFKRDEDDAMLQRFIREAHVMANLHHPHLVQIYDSGEYQLNGFTHYYIVMPRLSGGTLRARVRREPLSQLTICRYLSEIAGALDYIHSQGIIHRDIKSSNVLLDDEDHCYLTDFGIARLVHDATQLTTTGNVLGTADYVAPELFEVHRRADARSDLYSLGVLLYEMVTGRLPFSADNQLALLAMHVSKQPSSPRQYVPALSLQVERVILKTLEKQPEKRYGSAQALAEAFTQAVNAPAGVLLEQDELETVPLEMEPLMARRSPNPPGARPSPLAGVASDALAAPLAALVLPGAMTDTPAPPTLRPVRPPRRRRSRRALITLLIAFATLLVLAVPVTYTLLNPTTHPGGQGTATSSSSPSSTTQNSVAATATAHAQATASAIVAATATANAQATATVGPIATATSGAPAYQDALTNANNPATQAANWDQDNQCFFANDGYHIQQPATLPYFKGCREQSNLYLNLALTVNLDLLSGHSGGIFFRLNTNLIGNYDGYLFEIDNQGRYKISREQGATITALQDWTVSPALHAGYHTQNLLELIARNNTLLFYANGHFLAQAQDSYYSQAGTIGFLASSEPGGSDVEAVYSDLKVYALS